MELIDSWDKLEKLKTQGAVEGEQLDFKLDIPSNEKIAKVICAFANTSGGNIIFGAKYDDKITRKLEGFPGIDLIPDLDSRMEQIAMNIRPTVSVELSKPICLPNNDKKCIYTLFVHPGQLQPHQSSSRKYYRTNVYCKTICWAKNRKNIPRAQLCNSTF